MIESLAVCDDALAAHLVLSQFSLLQMRPSTMSINPYDAPTLLQGMDDTSEQLSDELAGRFARFAAAMVDGILIFAFWVLISIATEFMGRTMDARVGVLDILTMLIVHGYLLFSRGQTIGKLLTNIQIVDYRSGRLLPFRRVFVLRHLWLVPLQVVVFVIPGQIDDRVANIVALIGVLMIFGVERRCLHDYIAGSKVVLYRANREKLN